MGEDYLKGYRRTIAACEDRWGRRFRELVWGSMIYACEHGCGFEHRVLMGVGVEGPAELKNPHRYVPAPFYCGRCPTCGGHLHHERWDEDEEWEPTPIDRREEARFFVPYMGGAKRNAREHNYGGADYVPSSGKVKA